MVRDITMAQVTSDYQGSSRHSEPENSTAHVQYYRWCMMPPRKRGDAEAEIAVRGECLSASKLLIANVRHLSRPAGTAILSLVAPDSQLTLLYRSFLLVVTLDRSRISDTHNRFPLLSLVFITPLKWSRLPERVSCTLARSRRPHTTRTAKPSFDVSISQPATAGRANRQRRV